MGAQTNLWAKGGGGRRTMIALGSFFGAAAAASPVFRFFLAGPPAVGVVARFFAGPLALGVAAHVCQQGSQYCTFGEGPKRSSEAPHARQATAIGQKGQPAGPAPAQGTVAGPYPPSPPIALDPGRCLRRIGNECYGQAASSAEICRMARFAQLPAEAQQNRRTLPSGRGITSTGRGVSSSQPHAPHTAASVEGIFESRAISSKAMEGIFDQWKGSAAMSTGSLSLERSLPAGATSDDRRRSDS